MDLNDNRPSEPENSSQQYTRGHQGGQPAGSGYNSGYYGTPNYGNTNGGGRKRKGLTAVIAVIMVICLVVGGIFTAYVIMPGIYPSLRGEGVALATPDKDGLQPGTENPGSLTTDSPNIGGQSPDINYAENPIIQIAKEVGPAVVGIAVSSNQLPSFGYGSAPEEYGYGTGIVISPDGYIVTNNHVTTGSDSIKVTLFDGTEYPASLVGSDVTEDLAVIKIDAQDLTVAALGNSNNLQVGETVVAIGNPLGSELAGTVTSGIVSALNREITTNGFSQKYIQTDAAINPGNSGGPLVNLSGEVIGINTLKSTLAGYDDYGMPIGAEGIGFAIPITSAKPIIEQLITKGGVERPGIGITCIDPSNINYPSDTPEGVLVVAVSQGGPADKADLEPNDVILSIEGTAIKTTDELKDMINDHNVGDELNITIWRSGQEYKVRIKIGDLNNMG
jgi:serine protease Do